MSLVTGPIDPHHGCVVDAAIGVSPSRRRELIKGGFRLPDPVSVRLQLDTGASVTAMLPSVYEALGLSPLGTMELRTPSTEPGKPFIASLYHISLALLSNARGRIFDDIHTIGGADFDVEGGVQGVLGTDILLLCNFQFLGPERTFHLGW
jgi:hypothetical protein